MPKVAPDWVHIEAKQKQILKELEAVLAAKKECVSKSGLKTSLAKYEKKKNEMFQYMDQLHQQHASLDKITKEFTKVKDELVNSPEAMILYEKSLKSCLKETNAYISLIIKWFDFQCKDLKSKDKCTRVKEFKKIKLDKLTISDLQHFEKTSLAI